MLNIPVEVQNLLKSDSVPKNFRVHFPNGELDDITNENIIAESVTLTESLCSQNEFKFGLCESPMIEFECVDIQNIQGMVIECYIEVYCPVVVTGAVFRNDISAYVYPIPYGRFVVDESKKQADMRRRRVIAYARIFDENSTTSGTLFTTMQNIGTRYTSTLSYDPIIRAFSFLTDIDKNFFTKTELTLGDETYSKQILSKNGVALSIDFVCKKVPCLESTNKLYGIEYGNLLYAIDSVKSLFATKIRTIAVHCGASAKQRDTAIKNANTLITRYYENNQFNYKTYAYNSKTSSNSYTSKTALIPNIEKLFTPTVNMNANDIAQMNNYLLIPYQVNLTCTDPEFDYTSNMYDNLIVYDLTTSLFGTITASEKRKKSSHSIYKAPKGTITSKNATQYITYSLELAGMFCRINRNGSYDFFKPYIGLLPSLTLYSSQSLYPLGGVNIKKSAYQSVWYDDKIEFNLIQADYNNSSSGNEETVEIEVNRPHRYLEEWVEWQYVWGKFNPEYLNMRFDDGEAIRFSEDSDYKIKLYDGLTVNTVIIGTTGIGEFTFWGEWTNEIKITSIEGKSTYEPYPDPEDWLPVSNIVDYIILQGEYVGELSSGYYVTFETIEYTLVDEFISATYIVSNNPYLEEVSMTEQQATDTLSGLASSLMELEYVPCEITAKGRPDIEVGDLIEVETENGTFRTVILQRTLKGIQSLTDEYYVN